MAFMNMEINEGGFSLSTDITQVNSKSHLMLLVTIMKVILQQVSDESLHPDLDKMWASCETSDLTLVAQIEGSDSNDNDLRNLNL